MTLVAANQEVYNLLRDGIPVEFDDAKGQKQNERVRLIDFNEPDENRYLAVTQLWIKGERGFRRPDVLLYVNGLPLVFIELKNSNVKLKNAFDDNLDELQAGDSAALPDERLLRALERHRDQGRQHHGGVGAFSSTGCAPTTRRRRLTGRRSSRRARAWRA